MCYMGPTSTPKGALPPPQFSASLLWPNGWMDQDRTWHGGASQPRRPCGVRWGSRPLPKKGAEPPPQFSAHFYCGQTAGCTKMPLGTEVGLSTGDFVLDGDPAPSPQKNPSPIFGPFLLWPNGWMHQDITWYGGRPQHRGLCVRCGPSPRPLAHVYCGQTSGWIKMPLSTKAGLGPCHIVLDGDLAPPPPKGGQQPPFSANVYCGHGCPSQLLLSSCF